MDQSFENWDDSDSNKDVVENSVTAASAVDVESCDKDTDVSRILTPKQKLGEKAQATRDIELALMDELLQDLHGSLDARPTENKKAKDPEGLKVQLMPHQQYALAWLLWRERYRPAGGVLADDVDLDKTLTMISLIMTTLAQKDSIDKSDDDECSNEPLYHKGGTLVVCFELYSLFQWDREVQNRCERDLLTVEKYHGDKRKSVPELLSKNDIVITTYYTLREEYKTRSTLYKINWERVILDEAHVIRKPETQTSLAVCDLKANKRWALTGAPIQNKAMDLYPILRFLKCSPFDNLHVWKRWIDNKKGNQRLATIMKFLMLKRTKQELIEKGELESLPDKFIEEVPVELYSQEQLVYEKLLIYSRTLFAQFLHQKAEKEHMSNLYSENNKLAYLLNPNKQFSQNELMAMDADVQMHHIFTLLLRLRQLCCHPPLIRKLDQDDEKHEITDNEITDTENVDSDLPQMSNMSLNEIDKEEKKEVDIDSRIAENLLTAENSIFRDNYKSSKMRTLLNMVEEILQKDKDKLIIVSQWTTLLKDIASHLSSIKGATCEIFTNDKDRQNIIEDPFDRNPKLRILLLSLKAGGLGLNLVDANHLLLFDFDWNPQLEIQAQDRIYRLGQKKEVHVYKLICDNTIEEYIRDVQDRKLEIARNVLNDDKNNDVTKLTLNDLKSLFDF